MTASVYYETLFTSDLLTRDVLDARDEVWSFVRLVVSGDMQTAVMRPFSLQELADAVHGLEGMSCPGDDGLTRQFFMQYWDLISQPLQEGLQEIFDMGIMPQSMSLGIISLIPKGGDASTLRQWRPITLMSLDRSILDNVVTFYEALEWAHQTGKPTAIMLLDFEKAYDRVDWGFLEGTLHRMGFPDAWIRGISTLYRSASAAVTIGGHAFESPDTLSSCVSFLRQHVLDTLSVAACLVVPKQSIAFPQVWKGQGSRKWKHSQSDGFFVQLELSAFRRIWFVPCALENGQPVCRNAEQLDIDAHAVIAPLFR
ncbi:hypothetical protein L7F22_013630 [Adiantum nelumboides]|nr:hypothetical protein [Adiantum nelumboides]